MDLKEISIHTRNWIVSAQDRDYWRSLVNAALHLSGSISYGVSYVNLNMYRELQLSTNDVR